jgi:hypothetical protein
VLFGNTDKYDILFPVQVICLLGYTSSFTYDIVAPQLFPFREETIKFNSLAGNLWNDWFLVHFTLPFCRAFFNLICGM